MTSDPPGSEDAADAQNTDAEDAVAQEADQNTGENPDFDLPPWSIWYAVRLMWAGAVLSLVVLAVTFLTQDSIKDSLADQLREQHNYSAHSADIAYQNLISSTITVSLLGAAMWLWMARANGAGKKWARLIATTLGATTILGFALSFSADGVTAIQIVLSGLNVVLAGCAVALIWHPDSSDFYWYMSKPR